MPQLDPTWFASQLFWLAITFTMLYFVLSRYVLPPLMGIIAQRQQTVEGNVSLAQSLKSQAEQARQEYEKALAEAKGRAQQLMNDATADIKTTAEQKTREMDRQIAAKLQDATKQIAVKKTEMMAALAPATSELTSMIVEKLTTHAPNLDKIHQALSQIAKGGR